MKSLQLDTPEAFLRYVDRPGAKPPIVCLHGLGGASTFSFPEIVAHRRLRQHRALLVDLLGFGYSDRPETFSYAMTDHAEIVVRLLDRLEVQDATVVGHSMGGAVAILVGTARPNRVARLVLAESNLDPEPGIVSGIIARLSEDEYRQTGHARFLEQMRAGGFCGYARTLEVAAPVAVHRSAIDLIAPRTPTFRELLYSMAIPSTYLFGDESLGDPDIDRLPAHGIRVAIVPDAGHDMMTDNPAGLAERIGDCIESAAL